jgi:hypothetical protein
MTRSSIELKPLREAVEQAFLGPRALDEGSVAEFAGAVHSLIERATEDARALREAAVQADAAHARLAQLLGGFETRVTEITRSAEIRASALHAAVEANIRRAEGQVSGFAQEIGALTAGRVTQGSLAETVLVAQRCIDEMHATERQLKEMRELAEGSRRHLAGALLEAAVARDGQRGR